MDNKPNRIKSFFKGIISIIPNTIHVIIYMFLIWIYILLIIVRKLGTKLKIFRKIDDGITKFANFIDRSPDDSITKIELIDLAIKNMQAKKSRTIVTVGGMTIGIASIVFLVSIGFGVQTMVINQVATLDELKQMTVTTATNSNLYITDNLISTIKDFPNVVKVLPQIAVVGKVDYNNSSTDIVVYGVTNDYLKASDITLAAGKIFDNNETQTNATAEVKTTYQTSTDDSTVNESLLVGDWVEVPGESDTKSNLQISKLALPDSVTDKETVVNRAFLKVLGIEESEAIGKTFNVSFIATGKVLAEGQDRIESTEMEYTIVGVTPDDDIALLYVPFIHLKILGVENYSQLKVVVNNQAKLQSARDLTESQGYTTTSVADTVQQINDLFSTIRTVLALRGTVALLVAALGMFNTLTVSLLERTREVGLLKSMGMRSEEIRDSFLAESMIMGTLGGILGLLLGYLLGRILEAIFTILALGSGSGWITMAEIPSEFAILIIVLSFAVGVFTGIYPAKRATKISALNALRYE